MVEFVLWGLAKGETMAYKEELLACCKSKADVEKAKEVAAAHGFHSLRVSIFDGSPPDFKKTLNI